MISTRGFLPIYNQKLLIEAIPLVLKENNDIKFILAGDGYLRGEAERMVDALKAKNNVEFLGEVNPTDVPGLLSHADIYVSTSLSDLTSTSLLEALACGVFPIVTDIPANREWIKDGYNGFLVPTDQPQVLASRIIASVRGREFRSKVCEINAKMVKEKASWDVNMGKMNEFLFSLIGGESCPFKAVA